MNQSSRDAGIPLLTEVIDPSAESVHEKPTPEIDHAPHVEEPSIEALEAEMLAQWSAEEWNRLERKIRERILSRILARIDAVLEQQVRDHLADVLQTAVQGLANDIKTGLQANLEQVIARAVSQEITRLQARNK
jgi:catalase